jgi:3alpha(or 20beta)-hydroxysteroid dehydrogenase
MSDYTYAQGERLSGKVAVITGGARGIGEGMTRAFVAQGASVMIADVLEPEGAALADELGDRVAFVRLDVTQESQWRSAVAATVERFGSLGILVNNAGIAEYAPLGEATLDSWQRTMAINATGPFLGITAAVDALAAAAPASIINVSSISALRGSANSAAYCASKYAVHGLTKVAALDLATKGIRANSIHPGLIETPLARSVVAFPEDGVQPHIAMRRNGQPSEIAMAAVFLASDESSFVTGTELVVDGGQTAGSVTAVTALNR